MRKIEVILRYIYWSLREALKPCISYMVLYKNKKYYCRHSGCGYGYFDLISIDTKEIKFKRVEQKFIRPLISLKIFIHVFKYNFNFQKSSWYSIDCRKNIFSRISYINSNNIKF